MKIVLISQEYPPETANGGIATEIYIRAHGLAGLGHKVTVVSHSLDENKHIYMDKAVHVIRIPGFDDRMPIYNDAVRWLTYSMEVAVTLKELQSNEHPDLFVFPEWGAEGYVHLLNKSDTGHIPSLVHIHGPLVMFADTMNWPAKDSEFYHVGTHMEGTAIRLADALSASNKCSADWCREHYNLGNIDIPVLFSGIDTNLFYPRDVKKSSNPAIIFVGSIRRNKGIDLLVDAVCMVAKDHPGIRIDILGRGERSFIDELNKKSIDAGFPDLLKFHGQIGRDELPIHLSKAHLLAAPSVYEGGPGNVCLEAMACGIPVIATSGSGMEGIVDSGKNGILIEPGNLHQLADAIQKLLSDENLRAVLGKNAREFVLREADSRICLQKLEEYYLSVAGTKTTG